MAADATVHVRTSKPAPAEAAPAAGADEAGEEGEEAEEAAPKAKQGRKPRKASAGAKRGAPGTVKMHDSASGQPSLLFLFREQALCDLARSWSRAPPSRELTEPCT